MGKILKKYMAVFIVIICCVLVTSAYYITTKETFGRTNGIVILLDAGHGGLDVK